MRTLFEKDVAIGRTVAQSRDEAWALSDELRRSIVEALANKSMSIAEIVEALGRDRSRNTAMNIRHHIRILSQAGVIKIGRLESVRGAAKKYYTTDTRVLGHSAPDDFDEAYAPEIKKTARSMERVIDQLAPSAAKPPAKAGGRADPEYERFVMTEIVNRAMTRVFESRGGRA